MVRKIPKGKTMTYAEVARAVGSPRASRAVGNALNKNPRPIFAPQNLGGRAFAPVPCHRVIRSNGSIGGFAFGVKKKVELLKKEGVSI